MNTGKGAKYVTTTLPYVNAEPHIGFAMEIIRADSMVRYFKLCGYEVFFNTGTDEHGTKLYEGAIAEGLTPQQYVDKYAKRFQELLPALNISPDVNFIRTTDVGHIKSAQEFWKLADKNGFIYKKKYKIKYCVGCELEKTDSELDEGGKCPLHPNRELDFLDEENYFFKFSAFAPKLLELYKNNPNFVVPDFRLKEIRNFVERGLEDFSISRLKSKMPWGIDVPNDPEHVMYVWFDALVNYVSAIGWPDNTELFDKWWNKTGGVIQYCGKDNLRQQSAMWQAMLLSVGITSSQAIVVDGFVTGEGGKKMSKSLGNTINPFEIVEQFGTDTLRYFVTKELATFEDSPASLNLISEAYNTGLVNGLGNMASRVINMAISYDAFPVELAKASDIFNSEPTNNDYADYHQAFKDFNIQKVMNIIWQKITHIDETVEKEQPFKLWKTDQEKTKSIMRELIAQLTIIAHLLAPLLPQSSEKILSSISDKIKPILFPRK